MGGCCNNNTSPNEIYHGHRWDVIKVNDSTYMALPGVNADKKSQPVMFNTKNDKTWNQTAE